ncbi:TIGR03668 family PPOX class F420-dependent oxidoreductase [Sphaerisporangium album]|uniref:TIGR03668 family PPOX class F420-dependent oxidoreductase n=2 Tax=Sphaerisporangium album TaxID=509200 RepID=A0A367FF27_9ACTN|nr:TIGR03668 family PPOX class F420-dependent oxidoreductase [Sphaerisporangium album]
MRGARVARLATVGDDGAPHLVPITFAFDGERIVTAVDHKPKKTTDLRRIRNIRANPQVSILVDHYEDDWTRLWWVRADGLAAILERNEERVAALEPLIAKYSQYAERVPEGPVIRIDVLRYAAWSFTEG